MLEIIKKFITENKIKNFTLIWDHKQNLYKSFKITTIPTVILINKLHHKGRIIGNLDWKGFLEPILLSSFEIIDK